MFHHNDTVYDLLVIGGGITGLTAANHAALSGLRIGCLEGNVYGGLVANVERAEGYPAVQAMSGIDLTMALMQANMDMGVAIFPETVSIGFNSFLQQDDDRSSEGSVQGEANLR